VGRTVNLDALVGEDVEVVWRGTAYPVPADLPTDVVLSAARLEAQTRDAQTYDVEALGPIFDAQAAMLDRLVSIRTPGAAIAQDMGPRVVAIALAMIAAETAGGDVAELVADDAAEQRDDPTVAAALEAAVGGDPPTLATLAARAIP